MRHAVAAQCIKLWQTKLQGVVAKHVRHSCIQLRLLPRKQVATRWRLKPIVQTYNPIIHLTIHSTIHSTTHAPVTDFFLCFHIPNAILSSAAVGIDGMCQHTTSITRHRRASCATSGGIGDPDPTNTAQRACCCHAARAHLPHRPHGTHLCGRSIAPRSSAACRTCRPVGAHPPWLCHAQFEQ